eukprot:GDKK01065910.1.p1 GENE.GDKK01065910.1~~GDKK01065910.1.p1  ORF type:complete len:239 (+),score=66.55 GDKK01065910.1:46-762(+)
MPNFPAFPAHFYSNLLKAQQLEDNTWTYTTTELYFSGNYSRFRFLMHPHLFGDHPQAFHEVLFTPVIDAAGETQYVFYHIFPFGEKFAETQQESDKGAFECGAARDLPNIDLNMVNERHWYFVEQQTVRGLKVNYFQHRDDESLKAYSHVKTDSMVRTTNQADDPGFTDFFDLEERQYSPAQIQHIFRVPSACQLPPPRDNNNNHDADNDDADADAAEIRMLSAQAAPSIADVLFNRI